MYLYLNTASPEITHLALLDQKGFVISEAKIQGKYQQSEKLLKGIDRLICQHKLKGIAAVKGPGSFTALRIGIATANTLAFALGLSIVGLKAKTGESSDKLIARGYKLLTKARPGRYVVPDYGQEPRITLKKKNKD